ncbi:MgtC/SapB family protein [Desulfovulcanus sp.]
MDCSLLSTYLVKLSLTALLGGIIGFERESHGQSAGFRTNLLVAIGACLMMILSLAIADLYKEYTVNTIIRHDPARIASYAIASMGFLGAGAIIKGKGSVRGLTTAAGLWLITGIGLSVGAGFYIPAILTTFISLIVLYPLRYFRQAISHDQYTILTLKCESTEAALSMIKAILSLYQPRLRIKFINYYQDKSDSFITYKIRLHNKDDVPWDKIVAQLLDLPQIKAVSWEEADVP